MSMPTETYKPDLEGGGCKVHSVQRDLQKCQWVGDSDFYRWTACQGLALAHFKGTLFCRTLFLWLFWEPRLKACPDMCIRTGHHQEQPLFQGCRKKSKDSLEPEECAVNCRQGQGWPPPFLSPVYIFPHWSISHLWHPAPWRMNPWAVESDRLSVSSGSSPFYLRQVASPLWASVFSSETQMQ